MEHGDGLTFSLVPDLNGFRRRVQFDRAAFLLDVICRLGLKTLPLFPSHGTLQMMAKAAVAAYEAAVKEHERQKDSG